MKIVLAIATTGRAAVVSEAIEDLGRQSRSPDRLIVCAVTPDDIDRHALARGPFPVEVYLGARGLTRQRNAALDALADEDVILFLDDDFVMARDFLERLERLFRTNTGICVATGRVLADGIKTEGIDMATARDLVDRDMLEPRDGTDLVTVNNGYGCNMAFRCAPIRQNALRFDERLPLYGWLEDIDFSRRVAAHGDCVQASALRGVHLGTKGGRTSGLRLGYSQVANPVYLIGRATMRRTHAARLISRNILANVARCLRPEPWVDRRGRLRGNLLALIDLLRGRIDPGRVLGLNGRTDGRS